MDSNLLIGIIGVVLAVIGLRYTIKAFQKDHVDKPNEEKLHLMAQFKTTQRMSHQVYNELHSYVQKYNAFDQDIWPGITYGKYLSEMKKSQQENLSDELYESTVNMDLPSMTIQSMCKSLEQQYEALNLIHQEIKLKTDTIQ